MIKGPFCFKEHILKCLWVSNKQEKKKKEKKKTDQDKKKTKNIQKAAFTKSCCHKIVTCFKEIC